jgi:2-dehydro-3-deoxyphosphogluconate aldolase/(4S)-4-hydroxy-2-oxoglutarate aldolase
MQVGKLTAAELEEIGLVAIVRAPSDAHVVEAAEALLNGGMRAIEVTLNTPRALELIGAIREKLGGEMRVGAGTILSPMDAVAAIDAGAEFIVTPTMQPDTIRFCKHQGVPIACGCATPTESHIAHQAGADIIKVFPAECLGTSYIKAILGPLPFLKLMPTGGVSLDNLVSFIRAGCVGAGLGGNLVSRKALEDQDWPGLTALARQYVETLARARSNG